MYETHLELRITVLNIFTYFSVYCMNSWSVKGSVKHFVWYIPTLYFLEKECSISACDLYAVGLH